MMTSRVRRDGVLLLLLAVGGWGLGAKQPPASESWTRERAQLWFERDDFKQQAAQAQRQAVELTEERTRLLERLKTLTVERNAAREQAETAQHDVQAVGDALTLVTDEGARWRTEAEQRRAEVSELQQQVAMIPPEPPAVQKARTTLRQEVQEARKDTEYLWSKERDKLERRHADELNSVRQDLDRATTRLTALTEELRQVTQTARATEAGAQQGVERAADEVEQIRRRAAQAEADNLRALEHTRDQAAREVEQIRRRAAQHEQESQRAVDQAHDQQAQADAQWRRRLAAEQTAVRRTREDARRRINQAEQETRSDRVRLEQLRSGVMVDWAKLYVRVGVLEAKLGHAEEAERDFQYAVQLQPALASAYYNLGILYDDHFNNGPAAIEAYEQYLLLAPEAKDAKTVRGWVQLLKGTETANQDRQQWNRPGLSGLGKTFKDLWG